MLKKIFIALSIIQFLMVSGCVGEIENKMPISIEPILDTGSSETEALVSSNKVEDYEDNAKDKTEITHRSSGNKQIRKPIEKDGEDYIFSFDYYYIPDAEAQDPVNASVILSIFDPDLSKVQKIEFESWCDWGEDAFHEINISEWRVIDINFDGYQDIICLRGVGGVKANVFHIGWLWNPLTSVFEKTNIDDICNLSIHARDKALRSVDAVSAGHNIYKIYRYIGDRFVLTNQLDIGREVDVINSSGEVICNYVEGKYAYAEAPGGRFSISEMEVVDGVIQDVFPLIICNTSAGIEIIYNRLYGDDSIWFGRNSPNFFASAYGDGISGNRIDRYEE